MLRIEQSATVGASPEAVYALLADVGRRPEWLHELRRVEPPARLEPGARFTGWSKLALHEFVGESEVVRVEPGRAMAERIVLGVRFVSEWELVPVDDGTRVRHRLMVELPGGPLNRVERWVLRRRLAALQRASLAALSRSVL
jgi:uncharacterized protein YndB with AHSA1/START domain